MSEEIYFCALRDNLTLDLETPARAPECRWFLENTLPRWARDDVRAALADAAACWPKIAGVVAEEVTSPDRADLIIRCVDLGGAYGVLADCELPGPKVQHMRLDTSEQWVVKLGADVPQAAIDLNRVVRHEWGHFWGMGHAPKGSANLMAPTYSRTIWEPQGWEIQQMRQAYGLPKAPPPAPSPPAGVSVKWIVSLDAQGRELSRYEVIRAA